MRIFDVHVGEHMLRVCVCVCVFLFLYVVLHLYVQSSVTNLYDCPSDSITLQVCPFT